VESASPRDAEVTEPRGTVTEDDVVTVLLEVWIGAIYGRPPAG
jgi:hypothetical protein